MSLRILLADDSSAVLTRVKAFLEREGFEVAGEAADAGEAVRLAEAVGADVAVLDLSMAPLPPGFPRLFAPTLKASLRS